MWVYNISFLNLRDAKYLFAYTSKLPSDAECEPKTNGAGRNYSSYCGFRAIDAEAFVAYYWEANMDSKAISNYFLIMQTNTCYKFFI